MRLDGKVNCDTSGTCVKIQYSGLGFRLNIDTLCTLQLLLFPGGRLEYGERPLPNSQAQGAADRRQGFNLASTIIIFLFVAFRYYYFRGGAMYYSKRSTGIITYSASLTVINNSVGHQPIDSRSRFTPPHREFVTSLAKKIL